MLTHRNLMTMGLTYFVDVDPVGQLEDVADEAVIARVRDAVTAQCRKYPVYG